MSPNRPSVQIAAAAPVPRRKHKTRISSLNVPHKSSTGGPPQPIRRASASGLATSGAQKSLRTSKTSQKLVVLPEGPQTKPFPSSDEDLTLGYETDAGVRVKEYKNEGEKMNKEQRKKAGFKRITAYCVAEAFKMKLLGAFLKREHNVAPRVFDEALYVMYHLPLLPGYGPNANVRSSAPPAEDGKSILNRLSEAEENGYQGSYFAYTSGGTRPNPDNDGYMTSSPTETRRLGPPTPATPFTYTSASETEQYTSASETDVEAVTSQSLDHEETTPLVDPSPSVPPTYPPQRPDPPHLPDDGNAEVVFFEYGVVVFFGLMEDQEKSILEDVDNAGTMKRKIPEDNWEIEECHFTHDPNIAYPRIYNDFFTLKSRSHLLKISIAHALAQSTLLARFESNAQQVLFSPQAYSIPKQMATAGALQLRRHEALKLTGRLFKLRRDINLVSNVLDVPELFWDEASLKELYDAVREYMEIGPRVHVLNEKLVTASDFLDAIHDHLNNSAMERITWIIIWLIVVACLVELGEVIARLVVHSTISKSEGVVAAIAPAITPLSREDALKTLERMMISQS
ncbi:hypothetical protein WG66_005724 [Moniliophthora roreri]|nr:hypothetical protein WG66_005724 [Moniliophthora roreri]